ncbi:beta-ketoacyl synthase N-terminal-like domain-containing protein [Flavobacterium sp.]|uniref:beta-ketoacyl synthase N-terminal-like domain-containing protein n=1 Tax=Flavobacterium sp. TaxID=239 RepID=UPI002FD888D9
MVTPIAITAVASVSPLGNSFSEVKQAYAQPQTAIQQVTLEGKTHWAAPLALSAREEVERVMQSQSAYRKLDPSVLYALAAARKAVYNAGGLAGVNLGVNFGSSRGATQLFEKYHQEFLATGLAPTLTSPTTTLGNISSWVAHDLQIQGPALSHSITCSTSLHALLNGVAWMRAGMAEAFLVGGSEAPLTAFTMAQMKAMKIPSQLPADSVYPCLSLDLHKTANTMVLGEGAVAVVLEKGIRNNALAYLTGLGYATEILEHNSSISAEADCFQKSMRMALGSLPPEAVDVVVTHTPGTLKGDASEFRAIQKVFGANLPALTTNKWKIGHTFGASGLFSLEMALLVLETQSFIPVPFLPQAQLSKPIQNVLINAVGFGGNAVSVLVSKNP